MTDHRCLSEEDHRRIIREELKSLLESLRDHSRGIAYETQEIEERALGAVKELFEGEIQRFPHDWKCPKRSSYWKPCVCGVGDEEGE
jgi:hypothetical protein